MRRLITIFIFVVIFILYLYKLDSTPAALFCDETIAPVRAYELLQGDYSGFYNAFFYKDFGYVYGNLGIYTFVPFISLFGLTENTVRLVIVLFSFASLVVLYQILKQLKAPFPLLITFFFSITPYFYHYSRINFGQAQPLFFVLLGYYLYIKAHAQKSLIYSLFSGLCFAVSLYAYIAFAIATPLFMATLLIGEFFSSRFKFIQYKYICVVLLVFSLGCLPMLSESFHNPNFLNRLKEKRQTSEQLTTLQKVNMMIRNYPKYYTYDYLFSKGENDIPGAFIKRHSVKGSGILYKGFIPLFFFAFIGLLFTKDKNKKYYAPFFLLFFLYPLPNLITTTDSQAPYTVNAYTTLFFVPFLAAYGLLFIKELRINGDKKLRSKKVLLSLLVLLLIIESVSFFRNYNAYGAYSADYWGWQYGPRDMIAYFLTQKDNYDELYMSGMFNQPQVFFEFYDPEKRCFNCFVGGPDRFDPTKRQLFALTAQEYNEKYMATFKVLKTIFYPDNTPAFYIGEFQNNTRSIQ